jgi:predicted ester cyclase
MPTTTSTRNVTALTQAVDRWNAGDLDGYLRVYDDSIRLHGNTPTPMDKPAVRAFYEAIFAAFPGNRLDLHEIFGVDERLTCRFTLSGEHKGNFLGVPATGTQIALPGITILGQDAATKVANMIDNLERASIAPVEMICQPR